METQLKKRMEQVKELFTDCTDVFEELLAVKKHLAEKMEGCQSAIEKIQSSLSKINATDPKASTQIQVDQLLCWNAFLFHFTRSYFWFCL